MPVVDLPLSQLKTYQGRNPRPADHDAYWQRALDELRATPPDIERVPAKFQTPVTYCEDLYFTGTGGARLHARLVTPKGITKPAPAVCTYHGYSGSADEWNRLLVWAACGYTSASLDCRGQGGESTDPVAVKGATLYGHIIKGLDDHPDNLYFRNTFLDTARLVQIVQGLDGVDPTRVATAGGSQGGALSLVAAALEPSVWRCVSVFPFLCDYKRVWEMDLAKDAYIGLRDYFTHFDPLHEREEEVFTKLGYIDVQYLVPRIKAEVLFVTGLMDTICPPSTQFAAYNKITAPKKQLIYPDFGHAALPGVNDLSLTFLLDE